MRDGPEVGLGPARPARRCPRGVRGYHPLSAARADLLVRLGPGRGGRGVPAALELVGNAADRAYLERRVAELDPAISAP